MRLSVGLLAIVSAGGAALAGADSAPAQAVPAGPQASFDCARAASAAERMICGDAELRALDRGIAIFYASGRRNPRPGRAVREQREWLTTRDGCDSRACLRQAMTERLWELSESVGSDLPAYADADADAELIVADLGAGWYAFGAVGYWHGPTINSATASGAFHLDGGRGEVASASDEECAYTLTRLPRDRWRITAHQPPSGAECGGLNATVEGIYTRGRR
jgi:uncharacterized protein